MFRGNTEPTGPDQEGLVVSMEELRLTMEWGVMATVPAGEERALM